MARAARGRRQSRPRVEAAPSRPARDRIVEAFLELAAERRFAEIGLADIAARAGVTLAALREAYDGKLAIVADFSRRIDLAVLEGETSADEGPRDRLFEVLMRRFDALKPYRPVLKHLAAAARCDLGLARALHRISAGSQKWMLVAAGIHRGGPVGRLLIEGTLLAYLDTLRVFLDDDGADLGRTMAALDRALRRGERALQMIDDVCAFLPRFRRPGRRADEGAEATN